MVEEKYVQVRNLAGHSVIYNLPEEHIRREFGPTETKRIKYDEIQKLYERPGGATLIRDFLSIEDDDIAKEFGVTEDVLAHEYKWTVKDVDKLLHTGTLDELEDALDFAPEGIVDLIIDRAVVLRVPDIRKRKAILEHTGKDINSMIQNQIEVERQLGENKEDEAPKQRRVQSKEVTNTGRRAG